MPMDAPWMPIEAPGRRVESRNFVHEPEVHAVLRPHVPGIDPLLASSEDVGVDSVQESFAGLGVVLGVLLLKVGPVVASER